MISSTGPLVAEAPSAVVSEPPAWWRYTCAAIDAATLAAATRAPGATLRALAAAGRATRAMRLQGPSVEEVASVLPWVSPDRRSALAADIAALRVANRAAIALVHGGRLDRLAARAAWATDPPDWLERGGATLLLAWHVGAIFGIRAALRHAGLEALVLRDLPLQDAAARTRALKFAADHLRAGGLVVAMADGPGGTSTGAVSCLDRQVGFRRGPFTLARLTGCLVVPMAARWTPAWRIEAVTGPPIEPPPPGLDAVTHEHVLAARAAAWLDAYLRTRPGELWLSTLRHLAGAPRTAVRAAALAVTA